MSIFSEYESYSVLTQDQLVEIGKKIPTNNFFSKCIEIILNTFSSFKFIKNAMDRYFTNRAVNAIYEYNTDFVKRNFSPSAEAEILINHYLSSLTSQTSSVINKANLLGERVQKICQAFNITCKEEGKKESLLIRTFKFSSEKEKKQLKRLINSEYQKKCVNKQEESEPEEICDTVNANADEIAKPELNNPTCFDSIRDNPFQNIASLLINLSNKHLKNEEAKEITRCINSLSKILNLTKNIGDHEESKKKINDFLDLLCSEVKSEEDQSLLFSNLKEPLKELIQLSADDIADDIILIRLANRVQGGLSFFDKTLMFLIDTAVGAIFNYWTPNAGKSFALKKVSNFCLNHYFKKFPIEKETENEIRSNVNTLIDIMAPLLYDLNHDYDILDLYNLYVEVDDKIINYLNSHPLINAEDLYNAKEFATSERLELLIKILISFFKPLRETFRQ